MMSVNIANGLNKLTEVESYLCVSRSEGSLRSNIDTSVNYLFLNKKSTFDIVAINKLKKHIKYNEISIVHAHSSSYFIASIIKILIPKVKLIWHDHYGDSEHLNKRKLFPLKMLSRYFHSIISVNNLLKNWSEKNLKVKNVYYLQNFASFSSTSQETELNGVNGKRIVCVAGLRPQKDHLTLLKTFKIVKEKHQDWTLHLVGNHYDDEYYQNILLFLDKNNLSNHVFLYHNATDIKNILSQASIGVLSSISEGLPVSLLEYGLAKLPVIVTNVGECNKVLENGKFGMLVSPSDKQLLASSIDIMILNDELRRKFSKEFHEHIIENYSEQKIIHRLLDIYKC